MKYTTKAAEKSTVKITIKFDGEEWKKAQSAKRRLHEDPPQVCCKRFP